MEKLRVYFRLRYFIKNLREYREQYIYTPSILHSMGLYKGVI